MPRMKTWDIAGDLWAAMFETHHGWTVWTVYEGWETVASGATPGWESARVACEDWLLERLTPAQLIETIVEGR